MVRTMTERTSGRLVGGLFIAATLAGVLALVLHEPVGGTHDYLLGVGGNVGREATAALLELIMGIAVAAIAVAIYPILQRSGARMALGYVVVRAAEGLLIVIGTVGSLSLLTTGRMYVDAQASDASLLARGDALLADRVWVSGAISPIVFALSAVILGAVLYRARLVPRWLSLWGLLGGALWVVAGVLVIYGLDSSSVTPMAAPIALQEMVFAVYLIVRGFRANESAAAPEVVPELARA